MALKIWWCIIKNQFKVNEPDKCAYNKFENDTSVIICLYVDDTLIFGTDLDQVDKTKKFLLTNFEMKDMREADIIVGIKIILKQNHIFFTQSHNIEKKILERIGMSHCVPASTPMDQQIKLEHNIERKIEQL